MQVRAAQGLADSAHPAHVGAVARDLLAPAHRCQADGASSRRERQA